MPGAICLHGGDEFSPLGAELDSELLARAPAGPLVVAPLAAAAGREYDVAAANGLAHFARLGARHLMVAPDAREDEDAAYDAIVQAGLLVLPGGSPSRLLTLLVGTRAGDAVRVVVDRGGLVLGASAGGMVLCAWTWLPDRSDQPTVPGLGLVAGTLVLPHWNDRHASRIEAVRRSLPAQVEILGLPEQSGVLVENDRMVAVGRRPTTVVGRTTRVLEVGESTLLGR